MMSFSILSVISIMSRMFGFFQKPISELLSAVVSCPFYWKQV
jgi:hypothetical protein